MAITITRPNGEINVTAVDNFEMLIGEKLPADYRRFLLSCNGGKPESNEFNVAGNRSLGAVNYFYGLLNNEKSGDLSYEQRRMRGRVPEKILIIGDAEGGNAICMSLRPDAFGQVFFWDHELEADEGEPATFANLFKIGESFADFFERLRKFDASQIRLKAGQVKRVWIDPKFLAEQKKKGNVR